MDKKHINYSLSTIILLIIAFFQMSCKKEEPIKFSTDSFLYFINTSYIDLDPSNWVMREIHVPEKQFSFYDSWFQQDTISTNSSRKTGNIPSFLTGFIPFQLSVQMDGKLSDKKRVISIELEGDGKEFCVLPSTDSLYIPANGIGFLLKVQFVRPPLSDTSIKTVTIILKDNSDFSPEAHEWNRVTYKFGNWGAIPRNYNMVEDTVGAFSSAKMYAMQKAVSGENSESWKTDPDLMTLNAFLSEKSQRMVKVDPFTMDDLYYFLDLPYFLQQYVPSGGPIDNAYRALRGKMIVLTNALIVEMRNAGHPILDDAGNEIRFPQ